MTFARPLILRRAIPQSCIGSTRVAVDYLRERGVAARPLSVRLAVFNPLHTACLIAAKDDAGIAADLQELYKDEPAYRASGLWGIGLGYSRLAGDAVPAERWDGHVVCIVEERLLLDLSLDQVNRPQRNIQLGPVAIPVTSEWLAISYPGEAIEAGCMLRYEALPHDRSFEDGVDWSQPERWEPILRELRTDAPAPRRGWNVKGRTRNDPCPCNSGRKTKRCCAA